MRKINKCHKYIQNTTVKQNCKERNKFKFKSIQDIQRNKIKKYSETAANYDQDIILNSLAQACNLNDYNEAAYNNNSTIISKKQNGKTKFYGQLMKCIDNADILIEVLDARNPEAFRLKEIEELIIKKKKKLIIVINKVDLVSDRETIDQWVNYLKRYAEVITFKSMYTNSRTKNSSVNFTSIIAHKAPIQMLKSGYLPLGAQQLLYTIKKIASANTNEIKIQDDDVMTDSFDMQSNNRKQKSAIVTVGIIGMPNVGKSCIINSLLRNSTNAAFGNKCGITTTINTYNLTNSVKLIDTPGVYSNIISPSLNSIYIYNIDEIDENDLYAIITNIYENKTVLELVCKHYSIEVNSINCVDTLLNSVCIKKNYLLRNEEYNINLAAKNIIRNMQNGCIEYYQKPPQIIDINEDNYISKVDIVKPSASLNFNLFVNDN